MALVRVVSLQNLFTSQVALCNLPVLILVIVASLDNADKQLLASSFPLLEKTLHLSVDTLGYFSMFTNLSYALSLPLWGWLVHRYGMSKIHLVLSSACASWGIATIGIALSGNSIVGQAIFRSLVGIALGSILPLSQTMLVGMVLKKMRGRAFGYMGLCEKAAGTIAAAGVIYFDDWQRSYYILGLLSLGMAYITWTELTPTKRSQAKTAARMVANNKNKADDDDEDEDDDNNNPQTKLTVRQIIQRIARIPAFICLVAQGLFGGTPWDMMSFLLLLLDWRQFSKEQIVAIQFSIGVSSTLGGWIGGMLGDYAAATAAAAGSSTSGNSKLATKGRILVALVSVIGGIPLYGMFLFATNYYHAMLYAILFHLVATWAPAAALRPICADLARNPSERAQIVSLWIVLEKASGAIFGAPLVGYLTSPMVQMMNQNQDTTTTINPEEMANNAKALAWNLFGLSALFWSICAVFWVLMAYFIDQTNNNPTFSSNAATTTTTKDIQLTMHRKNSNIATRKTDDMTPLV